MDNKKIEIPISGQRYGEFTVYDGERYYLFPNAEIIAQANISDLRELQFSEKKAQRVSIFSFLITI